MSERSESAFDRELLSQRARLAELGGLAEEQLERALDAVKRRDVAVAHTVVALDGDLDRRAAEIEENALRVLAFRQPLGQDLRETVSGLRIASTLERVGDLSKNIARRTDRMGRVGPQRIERSIASMGRLVQGQLSAALDSYSAHDTDKALQLWRRDIEIDELHNSLFRDIIAAMTQDPKMVEVGAHMLFIAKNLERIGDHSTFLAEMTYYVVVGQSLSDERPKGSAMDDGQHSDPLETFVRDMPRLEQDPNHDK